MTNEKSKCCNADVYLDCLDCDKDGKEFYVCRMCERECDLAEKSEQTEKEKGAEMNNEKSKCCNADAELYTADIDGGDVYRCKKCRHFCDLAEKIEQPFVYCRHFESVHGIGTCDIKGECNESDCPVKEKGAEKSLEERVDWKGEIERAVKYISSDIGTLDKEQRIKWLISEARKEVGRELMEEELELNDIDDTGTVLAVYSHEIKRICGITEDGNNAKK